MNPNHPDEDREQMMSSTQGVWDFALIFVIVLLALTCMMPNMFIGMTHFRGRKT